MATEGFEVEEWDADFLDQLVQAEELALSTSATQPHHHHHHHHHPAPHPPRYNNLSYSPPRELSQRVHDIPAVLGDSLAAFASSSISVSFRPDSTKEQEIDSLKRELGRVSKQLTGLEEECIELKKERDKKEEQLKIIYSRIEGKEAENCNEKSNSSHYDGGMPDDHGIQPEYQNRSSNEMLGLRLNIRTSGSKAVGVQTDDAGKSGNSRIRKDLLAAYCHHNKLLGIWDLLDGEKSEKHLALKLYETCGTDFQVLFQHLNMSLPSDTTRESSTPKSDGTLQEYLQSPHSVDAAKISHLYLMLIKISNKMVRLEDLLEALIDCCRLKNGVIISRSLHVLHVVLKHASRMRKNLTRRDNFIVTGPFSEHITADMCEQESFESGSSLYPFSRNTLDQLDSQGATWFKAKRDSFNSSPPKVDWFSLFSLMNQIAMENAEEHVKLEAVSIMNTILLSCNAYSEREKFASEMVFQSISLLLRKEAGFCVRRQAVNLLYLLLNCPKVTSAFCFGCMENVEGAVMAEVDAKTNSSLQEFGAIVDGLVDCVSCTGNSTKELKLRRSAITVIAFIASLGEAGLGIVLNHRLPQRANILASILESLMSDVDLETLASAESFEVFKERTFLIRQALILLNRLVSHPQFSTTVLQALTSGRDVTSLTIDVAKRLSHKGKFLWQDDSMTKQIRESEIAELARVFKRRVFAFLGDDVS